MRCTVNGFTLEVTRATPDHDDPTIPSVTVRVTMKNGTTIFDSAAVSIEGLRNLGAVFDQAANLVYDELDRYYWVEQERNRSIARATNRDAQRTPKE